MSSGSKKSDSKKSQKKAESAAKDLRKKLEKRAAELEAKAAEKAAKAEKKAKKAERKAAEKAAEHAEAAAKLARKELKKASRKAAEKASARSGKNDKKKSKNTPTATITSSRPEPSDVLAGEVFLSPATETVRVPVVEIGREKTPRSKSDLPSTVPVVVEAELSPATAPRVRAAAEAAMKPSENWTVVALRARARQLGLVGYSSLTKAQLLERLRD